MIVNAFTVGATVAGITPILLAALAGALCGRVGVFNIALEGQILVAAFAAAAGSFATGSAWGGVGLALMASAAFASILAVGATRLRGDPIVISIAMNLLAAGLTAYLLRQLFGVSGVFSDPGIATVPRIVVPGVAEVPWLGWVVSRQTPITWAAWGLAVAVTVLVFRTPLGLRMRGVGEDPEAAATYGLSPERIQAWTVIAAGLLTGLAGAQLSLGTVGLFAEGMSAGRGWIAVVAVMLARDHPGWAAAACVLFGLADAASVQLQMRGLPNQLTDGLPYLVTLAALVLSARRRGLPA